MAVQKRSIKMIVPRKMLLGSFFFLVVFSTGCKRNPELVFESSPEELVVFRDGELITIEEFEKYIGEAGNSEVPVIIRDQGEEVGTVSAAEMRAALEKSALKKEAHPSNNKRLEAIEAHVGDFNYGNWPPN